MRGHTLLSGWLETNMVTQEARTGAQGLCSTCISRLTAPALTSTQNSKSTSKTKRDYAEILKEIQDLKIFYLLNVKVNFVSYCDMKTL